MKRELIVKTGKRVGGIRKKFLRDFRESMEEYFRVRGYRFLDTPLFFDLRIVDFVLVNGKGEISIVKIWPREGYGVEDFICDYFKIDGNRRRFGEIYPNENLNTDIHISVKLFIENRYEKKKKIFNSFSFQIELYGYNYADFSEETKIEIEELFESDKDKKEVYGSFFKIVGENVRSAESKLEDKIVPIVEVVSESDNETGGEKEPFEEKDILVDNIDFEAVRLSEEELIAFFDLEKKIESFLGKK